MAKIVALDTTSAQDYEYFCKDSISAFTGTANELVETGSDGFIDTSLLPDSITNGFDWKESARVATKTNVTIAAPGAALDGVTMALDDRVLLSGQTTASENGIYLWKGAAVPMVRAADHDSDPEVTSGNRVYIEEGTCAEQVATLTTNDPITVGTTGQTWSFQSLTSQTAGDGLVLTGNVFSVDLTADSGLEFSSGDLQINFADTSVAADLDGTNGMLAVKAENLNGNAANEGAKILGFDPANCATFTTTNIQAAMDELCAAFESSGGAKTATTDGTGVTKGDPLYFSANGIVSKYPNNTNDKPIGYAATTVGASATVTIQDTGTLTGVIAGATAGDQYYWDGTNHSTTIPSTAGTRIYPTGVAINATDLCIQPITRLKKNV